MALGAGKYDDLCTYVREQAQAVGACVIVIGGNKGMGFALQAPPEAMLRLADVLRNMADTIETDLPKDIAEYIQRN